MDSRVGDVRGGGMGVARVITGNGYIYIIFIINIYSKHGVVTLMNVWITF